MFLGVPLLTNFPCAVPTCDRAALGGSWYFWCTSTRAQFEHFFVHFFNLYPQIEGISDHNLLKVFMNRAFWWSFWCVFWGEGDKFWFWQLFLLFLKAGVFNANLSIHFFTPALWSSFWFFILIEGIFNKNLLMGYFVFLYKRRPKRQVL